MQISMRLNNQTQQNARKMNVKTICTTLKNVAEKTIRAAFPQIPAIVLLCSLAKRPGLSTIMSIANIVQRFKEKGIPTEPNEDGTPNLNVQMAYIIADEIYRALREDANIQGACAPGAVNFLGSGAGPSGPITVTGSNTLPFKLVGLIS